MALRRTERLCLVAQARELVRAAHLDQAHGTLRRVGKRVRDERIRALAARVFAERSLEYRPATRGNPPRLHGREPVLRIAVREHLVEDGPDDVEVARERRACVYDEQ